MSGDTVMTGSFPIFGQPVWDEGLQGDDDWRKTIENLMALKPKHVVPGHGPLAHLANALRALKGSPRRGPLVAQYMQNCDIISLKCGGSDA